MNGAGARSRAAFRRAQKSLVGGVDSPVRAFGAVGGSPIFFARGVGARLVDVDGRRYLDLVGSWGANLLGNAPPAVVRAVRRAAALGLTFGAPTAAEHELAERIRARAPALERLRFVSSGTEAVMSAVRVARGSTGRSKVIKFAGGYHGHSDGLLARAGSGIATHSLPDSAGVPAAFVGETLVAPYNDADALARLFEAHADQVAAVLVEPVAGNMNVVPPSPGFLHDLGRIAHDHGALVLADEVITGFRLGPGLAHPGLGLRSDLVTLGKVIGGGLPIGAYGGRADLMELVAPKGPVYQAGTLSGNPVVMAAGAAALDELTPATYRRLERTSSEIGRRITSAAQQAGVDAFHLTRVGSMLGLFFGAAPPANFDEALRVDRRAYARFFRAMLSEGVYLPPSPLETAFVSTAFRPSDVGSAGRAAERAFAMVRGGRG